LILCAWRMTRWESFAVLSGRSFKFRKGNYQCL
jgi:hypothetical protein